MREIEFRVWSKSYKEIVKVDLLGKNKVLSSRTWFDFNDIELMQYTGLKDKNGKKIFEGDIVRYYNDLYIIRFENGCFQFWQDCGGGDTYITIDGVLASSCEVVGNIWENSELLEE